jgi:hypothetical protein
MAKRGKRPTFFLAALVGGIALVLAAQPVVASTYYVDFTNSEGTSSDSRSGLSSSAAWIHCPGDASYTGSTALKLGDIVIFKKGITYSGQISTVSSGITYTISSWGTGTAVIDGGTRDAVFQVTHSSIRIDGGSGKALKLTGSGIVHAAIWSYGNSTLTGSTFTNLVIANVGNSSSEEGIGIKIGGNTVAYTY